MIEATNGRPGHAISLCQNIHLLGMKLGLWVLYNSKKISVSRLNRISTISDLTMP